VPGKVNIHAWRLFRNRLATRDNLLKRGLTLDSVDCPSCMSFPEDSDHLFTRCSTAREVGALLKQWWPDWPFNAASIEELWDAIKRTKKVGEVIGLAYLWVLWQQRNDKVYKGKMLSVTGIVNSIQVQALLWLKARSKFGNLINWDGWITAPMDSVCNNFTLAPR